MASTHITEIGRLLAKRGETDAVPDGPDGFFLEVRFDQPGRDPGTVDPELQNRVLTAETPYGIATIQFDQYGQLRSIDLS